MTKPSQCPWCGAALPRVSDPFCPECREDVLDFDGADHQREAENRMRNEGVNVTAITILIITAAVVIRILLFLTGR